jgi:dTDP-4-dehydrorhamnose reductase
MKILVTGASGQVGTALVKQGFQQGFEMFGMSSSELDITNLLNVDAVLAQVKPDLVINASAYTAVDRAETDSERAYAVNELGPRLLAKACLEAGIPLFHISTDYVFDGVSNGVYSENDLTNPQSVYGRSKLMGELAVKENLDQYIILRTSWVFSETGSNFVKTMLRLGAEREKLSIVSDQVGGPTSADSIANALLCIAARVSDKQDVEWGTYHFTGHPYCSWYEFAKEIFQQVESLRLICKAPELTSIPSSEYPTPAPRPLNSKLDCSKIYEEFGIQPDDWKKSLKDVVLKLK